MTPKERMVTALTLRQPDEVPTFELEFQLEEEMFGLSFDYGRLNKESALRLSPTQEDVLLNEYAEHLIELYYYQLEYASMPLFGCYSEAAHKKLIRLIKEKTNDYGMIHMHGDGTFSVPDGNLMYEFAYRTADDYEGLIAEAATKAAHAVERNKIYADAGIDLFILCDDYCYNSGPFISPEMFRDLITPHLAKIVAETKQTGAYVIKHTDGNIMPILDQLVECEPHALHSLDPMAKVDIAEVKRLVGHKVALCGNVNCALMQTGTDEEVLESCRYAMESGKPGGGYVFTTSNVPFKGMPPERYRMMLDYWKANRVY